MNFIQYNYTKIDSMNFIQYNYEKNFYKELTKLHNNINK